MPKKIRRRSRILAPKPQKLRHRGAHKPRRDVYGRRSASIGRKLVLPLLIGGVFVVGLVGGIVIGNFPPKAAVEVDLKPSKVAEVPPPPKAPSPKKTVRSVPEVVSITASKVQFDVAEPTLPPVQSGPKLVLPKEVKVSLAPPKPIISDLPSEIADAQGAKAYTPESLSLKHDMARQNLQLASLPRHAGKPFAGPGLPPWRANAVAPPIPNGRPKIAIVIDDLGLDRRHTSDIINLPGPLTTAFLSYMGDIAGQTGRARARGHELLIHVAMEPMDPHIDPGPDVLLTRWSEAQIRNKLDDIMGRFKGYVGINNHMGSLFTADPKGMAVVMDEMRSRGLMFLDSRTSSHTVGPVLAEKYHVPTATRHVFLDNEPDSRYVLGQLHELEGWARRQGFAVGIGHPKAWTIEALRQWLPTLEQRGFQLVPISAIALQNMMAKGPS